MVGEIVNNIRAVLILILGLLIGLAFGVLGPVVGLGLVAVITAYIMIVSSPDVAICVLTGYAVIDWVLRLVAEALAGAWDELYLVVLILMWIYKWRSARNGETIKVTSMDLPIIIFIGVMLFALIINSTDYSISLEGFRAIVQYILWYFVVLQLVNGEKSARKVTMVFVIVTGIMALHGVFQYIVGVEMPAGWVDQNEAGVRTRVFSILTSPNVFGSLLTLATPMSISMCLSSKKKGGKFIFGFLALMMAASLVFTFSRGAWIGFVLAIGIYILLKDKRLIIPGIVLAVLVVALVPSVGNRIGYMLSPEYIESSLRGGRLVRWLTGLRILEFYPWLGVGLGQFGGAVAMNHQTSFLVDLSVVKTFYMDNYYLKTAVESGIVGFSAFVMLMYSVIINSFRTLRSPLTKEGKELATGIMAGLCGVITHNWVENVFETPLMASVFWIFVGVIMAMWYSSNKAENK